MSVDVNFMVGGEAGQGVQSVGFILAKALSRGGLQVFADQDYESRIRGGHSFFRVRVRDREVGAFSEVVDVLVCLNKQTLELHRGELAPKGLAIFDSDKVQPSEAGQALGVPLARLAVDRGGNKIMANTVALGAALGLVGYDLDILAQVLRKQFRAPEVGEANVRAAAAGYEFAREMAGGGFPHRLTPLGGDKRLLLNSNEAIALGALAAGCKFMAGYPMTPSTPILEFLAERAQDFNLAVVQPEDEISAVNMAIGASFAGVRAMTATSGSGFCLMVEGLGLAGITETPLVVVNGQRPGPAVGLPTRTEQGDLLFMVHAHHGDFPRAILAPDTAEGAFFLTFKAFNLAEKYQIPVIILNDHHLATSYATVDKFDLSGLSIDRGLLLSDQEISRLGEYKRHLITESGISPRARPGQRGALVCTDSDEHDEAGHLIEDAETRTRMMSKRLRKLEGLRREVEPPRLYGPKGAETTLIGWGSTYGALREAVDILRGRGLKVNQVHLRELWPFPGEAFSSLMGRAKRTYVVENNATGQLAHLIRAETGMEVTDKILKFDGRPFSPAYIVRELEKRGV